MGKRPVKIDDLDSDAAAELTEDDVNKVVGGRKLNDGTRKFKVGINGAQAGDGDLGKPTEEIR